MADAKLTALTAAAALDGTELLYGSQGGNSRKITTAQIKTYAGAPGGATTTVQYNNAGAFGGMSGTAWDEANRALTITGATVTISNPSLNITQTWNAGAVTFYGQVFNVTSTASAALSRLASWQLAGVEKAGIVKDGSLFAELGIWRTAAESFNGSGANGIAFQAGGLDFYTNSVYSARLVGTTFYLPANVSIGGSGTTDAILNRVSAGVIKVTNGGAGASAIGTTPVAVASLMSAATAGNGARAFVTDALAPTFGATVAAGGAVSTPVYSDGTNWKVG